MSQASTIMQIIKSKQQATIRKQKNQQILNKRRKIYEESKHSSHNNSIIQIEQQNFSQTIKQYSENEQTFSLFMKCLVNQNYVGILVDKDNYELFSGSVRQFIENQSIYQMLVEMNYRLDLEGSEETEKIVEQNMELIMENQFRCLNNNVRLYKYLVYLINNYYGERVSLLENSQKQYVEFLKYQQKMIRYLKNQMLNLNIEVKEKEKILNVMKQTMIYVISIQDMIQNGSLKQGIFENIEVETYLLNVSMNIVEVYIKMMNVRKYLDEYTLMIQVLCNLADYLEEKALDIGVETTQIIIDFQHTVCSQIFQENMQKSQKNDEIWCNAFSMYKKYFYLQIEVNKSRIIDYIFKGEIIYDILELETIQQNYLHYVLNVFLIWLIECDDEQLVEDMGRMFKKDNNKLILMVLDLTFRACDYEVRLESLDTVSLIIKLSQEQIIHTILTKTNFINELIDNMTSDVVDVQLVIKSLGIIQLLFDEWTQLLTQKHIEAMFTKLEQLQDHESQCVFDKAEHILENNFQQINE